MHTWDMLCMVSHTFYAAHCFCTFYPVHSSLHILSCIFFAVHSILYILSCTILAVFAPSTLPLSSTSTATAHSHRRVRTLVQCAPVELPALAPELLRALVAARPPQWADDEAPDVASRPSQQRFGCVCQTTFVWMCSCPMRVVVLELDKKSCEHYVTSAPRAAAYVCFHVHTATHTPRHH